MDAMGARCFACAGAHPFAVDERPCVDVVGDACAHHCICPLERYIRRSKIAQYAVSDVAESRRKNIGQLRAFGPDVKPCWWFFRMCYIIEHSSILEF